MIETREQLINGSRYTVTQMTARRALRMKAKLIKMFGKPLSHFFFPSEEGNIPGMQFSRNSALTAIESLCETMDDKSFESVLMELLQGVRKEGMELTEAIIDLEFAGDLSTLYQVIWFVLEANYANFFQAMGITLPSHDQAKETRSNSSKKELKPVC